MKNLIYKSMSVTLTLAALFLFAVNSARAQDEREIREMIPARETQISDGCGGASVKIEVDFTSFGSNKEALTYVPSQGLEEMTYGLIRYCTDSNHTSERDPVKVGKLKAKVKKVVLKFVPKPSQKRISLQAAGGVLVIEEAFGESGGTFYQIDIREELVKIL